MRIRVQLKDSKSNIKMFVPFDAFFFDNGSVSAGALAWHVNDKGSVSIRK